MKSNSQAITNEDLISAAKIAEDFENPKLPDENLKKILRKGFTSLTPHKQPDAQKKIGQGTRPRPMNQIKILFNMKVPGRESHDYHLV